MSVPGAECKFWAQPLRPGHMPPHTHTHTAAFIRWGLLSGGLRALQNQTHKGTAGAQVLGYFRPPLWEGFGGGCSPGPSPETDQPGTVPHVLPAWLTARKVHSG